MLLNLLGLGVLVFLAFACFTLFLRSIRSPHLGVKIAGSVVSGLLTLLFIAAIGSAFFGLWRTSVPRTRPTPDVQVAATPELVSRGQAVAQSCIPCHSSNGEPYLNGGTTNLAANWGPYGQVYGPNLTPGGEIKGWTDGEIIRAIREGYDESGRPLVGHPAAQYAGLSDDDAAALVAFLRSQPALRHDQPPRVLNLLGLWAAAGGLVPTSEQPPFVIDLGGG